MSLGPLGDPYRRPSLEDVASAAGVAKSTAARALKGAKHVARKTSRVVLEAAEKLGYQPDPMLSKLARERWRRREGHVAASIALVHRRPPEETDRLQAELDGMHAVAGPRGYQVEVLDASQFSDAGRLQEVLLARGYRGLVFGPMHCPPEWLQLDWERFTAVSYGVGSCQPPLDLVSLDHFRMTVLALREMRALGYRRIGLAIVREAETQDHEELRAAYHFTLQEAGEACEPLPVYEGESAGPGHFLAWVAEHAPEAVLGNGPVVHAWLRGAGVAVPQEVACACLVPGPGPADACLAGIRPEFGRLGQRVMELLDHHICTNTRGLPAQPARLLIHPVWRDGTTLPPRAL